MKLKDYISKIKIEKVCEVANDNADGQIIVSGDKISIESLQNILKKEKKIYNFTSKCTISLLFNEKRS